MHGITLHQLRCFDAVVSQGSFQAAAAKLHRTHPTIAAAIRSLEQQLGFALLHRGGYRAMLTDSGRSFHERARNFLDSAEELHRFAACIARGEETQLRVMLDDAWPSHAAIAMLNEFFLNVGFTQLQLDVSAHPCERLLDGTVDLIFHRNQRLHQAFEYIRICEVEMIPVAAPGFFRMPLSDELTNEQLKPYVQCVARGMEQSPDERFALSGARLLIIGEHQMRRQAILQGMAWGYLPSSLAEDDLRFGRLLSIAGKYLKKSVEELSAARLRVRTHGTIATRLWAHLQQLTPVELRLSQSNLHTQYAQQRVTA